MNKIIEIRNKIEELYYAHKGIFGYAVRLVIMFLALLVLRTNVGYNTFLTNLWVILAVSVLGAFLPVRFFTVVILAYIIVQMFTFSIAIGIVTSIVLTVVYLLYFRYAPEYGYVLVLIPLLFIIRLELVVVLILAVSAPVLSALTVAFGTVFYFLIRFININAATLNATKDVDELTKAQLMLEGVFTAREFWYMLFILIAVFMVVFLVKRINVNYSFEIAIASGTGLFIVLTIVGELLLGSITTSKLLAYVFGGLGAGIITMIYKLLVHPLDYSRTETVEFEDEEYQYFVRAIPKASYKKETISVKKINKRRQS